MKMQLPGPGAGNVDIPIGILMILGCVSPQKSTFPHKTWNVLKFHNFQEILWNSWISWFSLEILILQWRAPQNHQYSLRNINVFAWAAREAPVSRENWNFQEIHRKPWTFQKLQKFCGNAKSGNRGWAPKRAPDPAPLGAPCYHKTVGAQRGVRLKLQKSYSVYKQKWKGEIHAWGKTSPLFIFPYKPNGILVILIKRRATVL